MIILDQIPIMTVKSFHYFKNYLPKNRLNSLFKNKTKKHGLDTNADISKDIFELEN